MAGATLALTEKSHAYTVQPDAFVGAQPSAVGKRTTILQRFAATSLYGALQPITQVVRNG